jgi:hypothetical protein
VIERYRILEVRSGRKARPVATFVLSLVIFAVAVQPAWAGTVAPGGSDVGNDCSSQEEPCATIQHAIDEAAAGESITVRPGTYVENLTIDKPLTLSGPDGSLDLEEPQAIIDGGSGTAISVEANGVTISGLTVKASASGGVDVRTSGPEVSQLWMSENLISGGAQGIRLESGGAEDWINFNQIEGAQKGIAVTGGTYSKLDIDGDKFIAPAAEFDLIAGVATKIEGLEMWGDEMSAPVSLDGAITEGDGRGSWLVGNTFDSTVGPLLAIDGNKMTITQNHFEGNRVAGCLRILGEEGSRLPSADVSVYGENEFTDCNPYGVELDPDVEEIAIYGNDFGGSYDGILTNDATPWNVDGKIWTAWNRLVGTTHLGIDNTASGTLEAEQNWWGCNAGPGGAGCDQVSANVDTRDNAELVGWIGPRKPETGIEELPPDSSITLNPGEEAEVWAVLAVEEGRESILDVPTEKTPVGFSASNGTLSWSSDRLSNGWAPDFFTAGTTPGPGFISLSMDNQHTLVPVTITGEVPTTTTSTPPSSQPPIAESAPLVQPSPKLEPPDPPTLRFGDKPSRPKARRVVVGSVACASTCHVMSGHVQVMVGGHRYQATVGSHGTLAAGSTTPLQIDLSGSALRALKADGSGRIRGTITVVDAAGHKVATRISTTVAD